jgi:hypothetical protein
LKDAGSAQASSIGRWTFCGTDTDTWLEPGDMLKADDGTNVRKYTIPNLTAELDRVNNVAKGTGPAHRTIRICSTFALLGDFEKCHIVRVGDDGTWSYNPHTDIIGGLNAGFYWKSPKGDTFFQSILAPQVTVTLAEAAFSGIGAPRSVVDVSADGANDGSAQVMTNGPGVFSGKLRDSQGHLGPVRAGDHVVSSIATDADWIAPSIHSTTNTATDVVSGVCEDTGALSEVVNINVIRSGHVRGRFLITFAENGAFSVDFGGQAHPGFTPVNIRGGDKILVGCMIATGDWVQRQFMAP